MTPFAASRLLAQSCTSLMQHVGRNMSSAHPMTAPDSDSRTTHTLAALCRVVLLEYAIINATHLRLQYCPTNAFEVGQWPTSHLASTFLSNSMSPRISASGSVAGSFCIETVTECWSVSRYVRGGERASGRTWRSLRVANVACPLLVAMYRDRVQLKKNTKVRLGVGELIKLIAE